MTDSKDMKNKFIKMLDNLNYDADFVASVKDFIDSYDGTNQGSFMALMTQIVLLIMYVQKLEAKAKGFDELSDSDEDFKIGLNKIKADYEKIMSGQKILDPPQFIE